MRAGVARVVLAAGLLAGVACGADDRIDVRAMAPSTSTTAVLLGDALRYVPRPVPTTRASRSSGAGGRAADVGRVATTGPARGAAGTTARVSWYGSESGTRTANGEHFEPAAASFAHRSMAFGTRVQFCHDGRCVVARCNDRGPAAWTGRDFDLSRGAFGAIAPLGAGVVTVTWSVVG